MRVKLSVFDQNVRSNLNRCGLCGVRASSFQLYRNKFVDAKKSDLSDPEVVEAQKVIIFLLIDLIRIFNEKQSGTYH